jgi:hypothetical protein
MSQPLIRRNFRKVYSYSVRIPTTLFSDGVPTFRVGNVVVDTCCELLDRKTFCTLDNGEVREVPKLGSNLGFFFAKCAVQWQDTAEIHLNSTVEMIIPDNKADEKVGDPVNPMLMVGIIQVFCCSDNC